MQLGVGLRLRRNLLALGQQIRGCNLECAQLVDLRHLRQQTQHLRFAVGAGNARHRTRHPPLQLLMHERTNGIDVASREHPQKICDQLFVGGGIVVFGHRSIDPVYCRSRAVGRVTMACDTRRIQSRARPTAGLRVAESNLYDGHAPLQY